MSIVTYLLAVIPVLAAVIVFHELGHYAVARWCGVKVLRFCLGFGRPIWSRRFGRDQTEWAIAAFPLGGYVKMLDEREGPVDASEVARAFNRQAVGKRMAIVVAGPLANFLLAILLYWGLLLHGVPGMRPIVAQPVAGSSAAAAGFEAGETLTSIAGEAVRDWQEVRLKLLEHAQQVAPVTVEAQNARGEIVARKLDLSKLAPDQVELDILTPVGLTKAQPRIEPVAAGIVEGGAGALAGLREGDRILSIDDQTIESFDDVVNMVRAAPGKALHLKLRGQDQVEREVVVTPERFQEKGTEIGRMGVKGSIGETEKERFFIEVRYSIVGALTQGVGRTWETSVFSLKMLGKMVLGQVSLRNISGPITIADYAGQSAQHGALAYLNFIALISISLGILNLLPVPLLDGGHLMYYVAEVVKGSPVPDRVMEIGQQIGMVLLFTLMAFALYNDVHRLVGG